VVLLVSSWDPIPWGPILISDEGDRHKPFMLCVLSIEEVIRLLAQGKACIDAHVRMGVDDIALRYKDIMTYI
jgi:hypothetical protein